VTRKEHDVLTIAKQEVAVPDTREYGNCPVCLWHGRLRSDGTVRKHYRASVDTAGKQDPMRGECPGTGQMPYNDWPR
jgi:hypothetical protein